MTIKMQAQAKFFLCLNEINIKVFSSTVTELQLISSVCPSLNTEKNFSCDYQHENELLLTSEITMSQAKSLPKNSTNLYHQMLFHNHDTHT